MSQNKSNEKNRMKKEMAEKQNGFYSKLNNFDECDEIESKEIIDHLNSLSKDDLKVIKSEKIKI